MYFFNHSTNTKHSHPFHVNAIVLHRVCIHTISLHAMAKCDTYSQDCYRLKIHLDVPIRLLIHIVKKLALFAIRVFRISMFFFSRLEQICRFRSMQYEIVQQKRLYIRNCVSCKCLNSFSVTLNYNRIVWQYLLGKRHESMCRMPHYMLQYFHFDAGIHFYWYQMKIAHYSIRQEMITSS